MWNILPTLFSPGGNSRLFELGCPILGLKIFIRQRKFDTKQAMKVLIINQSEVYQLLPMHECMDLIAEALLALTHGNVLNPLRQVLHLPNGAGLLGIMPAYVESCKAIGLKVLSIFSGNRGPHSDSHQGAVLVFETDRGRLLAIIDAGAITAIRTPAMSGLATRVLACEDASDLAILGSGVQAQTHMEAMVLVRPIRRCRVWRP
jgi:alanine dehydrogenase